MKEFSLFLPKKVVYGKNILYRIAEIKEFGRKCVLFVGKSFAERSGVLEKIKGYLIEAGMHVEVFKGVEPEPDLQLLEEGRRFCRSIFPDVIVGMGGGSVLDVAKACAALLNEDGEAREYQAGRKIEKSGAPFVAVPTTCGSGAEATYNAVIMDKEMCAKRSIRDFKMMAHFVLIDTEFSLLLPRDKLASSAADALSHAIEGYISKNANPFTDVLAEEAVKIIATSLRKAVLEEEREAKEKLCFASFLGGVVLANAGLGACHGLAASIGALTGASHGVVCAVLLPSTLNFNKDVCKEKFLRLASFFGCTDLIKALKELFLDIGIPKGLKEIGMKEEYLKIAAENVSSSVRYNPKEATYNDLLWIMEDAF